MKLGKFLITVELTQDKDKFAALTDFITKNCIILERIVVNVNNQQAVLMISTCDKFDGLPDRAAKIPEYVFEFSKSLILSDAADWICNPMRKK